MIVYTPSLKSELRGSTAMTPTQHKGGGFKAVIGIAAAIAIPFAAPAIAASIAGSFGVAALSTGAATALSAGVGAALGGLSSYALGGNPLLGAAGGAVGGGIGGFSSAGGFSGATPASAGGVSTAPAAGGAAAGVSGATAPATSAVGLTSASTPGSFLSQYGAGFGASGAGVGVPSLGSTLSGYGAGVGAGMGASAGAGAPSLGSALSSSAVTAVPAASTPGSFLGQYGAGFGAAGSPVPALPAAGGLVSPAQPAQPGLLKRLGNAAEGVYDRVTDTDFLLENGLKLGANQLTDFLVGDTPEMSSQEREFMQQRAAALARLDEQQQATFAAQQRGAEAISRDAEYYDPNLFGAQASFDAINRMRRSEQERLASIPRNMAGLRTAEQRRGNLDTARVGSAAFATGYNTGARTQTATRVAGLGALPAPSAAYATALAGDQNRAAGYYGRLEDERKRTADYLIDPLQDITGA